MSEHTHGKLELAVQVFDNDGCPETVIQGMNGAASVAVALDFGSNNPGMREANARRLVAAWNACEHLATDTLEVLGNVTDAIGSEFDKIKAERDSLRAVNAELIKALEKSLDVLQKANEQPNGPINDTIWFSRFETLFDFMGAAIASARKQGEQA